MEEGSIAHLDTDAILHIFNRLEAGRDVACVSAVSKTWYRVVVEGRVWRSLCLKKFPDFCIFEEVAEVSSAAGADICNGTATEHRVCNKFYWDLTRKRTNRKCILRDVEASSTDNFPKESIAETLRDSVRSYWSSKGQHRDDVPETLTYQLDSPLSVIYEIFVRPFKAFFQRGQPIYSSHFVRFKFGYSLTTTDVTSDKITWTYVSPLFQMLQVDELQKFTLPRPVICIGGYFQVELIGRAQAQAVDELYYICVADVDARGNLLSKFDVGMRSDGAFVLKLLSYRTTEEDDELNEREAEGEEGEAEEEEEEEGEGEEFEAEVALQVEFFQNFRVQFPHLLWEDFHW